MNHNHSTLPIIALLSGLTLPPAVQAAAVADDNDIIVTATRLNMADLQAGSITVISATDIEHSPATTLPEILATEAGVVSRSLYGNSASRATVDMRGFGAAAKQNTLVLLDGRRLNDIDLAAIDFAAIPLANIERIEIIRGGGSVLYGDGASGGIINIISKKAAVADSHSNIAVSLGSFNERELDINSAIKAGATSINVAANAINSDGFRDNNALKQRNVAVGARQPLANGDWYINVGYNDQSLGLPGVRTVDPGSNINELVTDRNGTATPNDYADQDGIDFSTDITRYLSENTEWVLDLAYRDKNQQAFYDYGGGFSDYVDTGLSTWSLTPRLTTVNNQFGIESTSVIGVDIYASQYESDRGQAPTTAPIHQLAIDQLSTGLYASNQTRMSQTTSINAGARIQMVRLKGTDQYDATAPGAFGSEAPRYDDDYSELMWQLGLRQRINNTVSVYGGIERAARFATVDELFELDSSFQQVFSPLKPQTANQVNLGLDYAVDHTRLNANLFYMDLDNEIHFDPVTFTNINLEPTKRQGIELSLNRPLTTTVDIKANISYQQAEFKEGSFAGNTLPLVPNDTASLTVNWHPMVTNPVMSNTRLAATVDYVGEQYFDNDQSNSFGSQIPSFTTLNLGLSTQLEQWTVSGRINNVFDEKYFNYGVSSTATAGRYNAYPQPGRVWQLTVARQF